jgi:exopolysaccharide biosynthesis polyprenyl glycosylphosphotransferase
MSAHPIQRLPSLPQREVAARRRVPGESPVLVAAEAVALGVALAVSPAHPAFVGGSLALTVLIQLFQCDLVRPRITLSAWREAAAMGRAALPALAVASLFAAFRHHHSSWVVFGVAFLVAATVLRLLATAVLQVLRRRGACARPAVVLGDTDHQIAQRVAAILQQHPELGLRLVGRTGRWWHADLPELSTHDLAVAPPGTVVILATRRPLTADVVELVHGARGVEFFLTLRHLEASMVPSPVLDYLWTVPVGWLRSPSKRFAQGLLKRTSDVLGATLLLLVAAPLMLALAVAVRCSSPGPVLFRQRRIGRHGREFNLLKFRTMRVHTQGDTLWSVVGNAQVTRIGRLLRRTSLDELPQLLNILWGDMSLVGPRPERPHFARRFAREFPSYWRRHRLSVGLTGLAQVNGLRGDTSIAERAEFDNRYIDRWSFFDDVSILLRTLGTPFRRGDH